MQKGRGGMGTHKHGVSGHAGRSPRFKMASLLAARKEEASKKKPSGNIQFKTVHDILASEKKTK